MRLFTGLDVPYEMRRNLELLLQHLKPKARISWSSLDNLHITTKFIGEWPEDRLEELKAALGQIARPGPLPIGVRGLGWFPNPHSPRVFFVAIAAPPELEALARESDRIAASVGISSENRPFQPHLTLARIRDRVPLVELRRAIAELPSVDFGAFTATHHHLYLSTPKAGGSVYTKLASWPLTA